MAQKNILNQVKTADGYDTLYPLTPYQIHQAKTVTGNGSNYAITIDLPAENITVPIIVSFTPNVPNTESCTMNRVLYCYVCVRQHIILMLQQF